MDQKPRDRDAQQAFLVNLDRQAELLARSNRLPEARKAALEAIGIRRARAESKERTAEDLCDLARALINCEPVELRDPTSAADLVQKAVDLSRGQDPQVLDTLALVYLRTGATALALSTAERALALLPPEESGKPPVTLRAQLEARLQECQEALR